MKRSCKDIDLTDVNTVYPAVYDCIMRHCWRWDFRTLLCTVGGMDKGEYRWAKRHYDKHVLEPYIWTIARVAVDRIKNRNLELDSVKCRHRIDGSSGKLRRIGKESPMQQVFDHIACDLCEPIWKRRIVPQQASSIKGRGQVYGIKYLKSRIDKDNRAANYAKAHGFKYTRKTKYSVKLDVSDCFGSGRVETFLKFFRRDCGNELMIWLWVQLLNSHQINGYLGFMIGALPSQWAMQYLLSFAYRYVKSLHTIRRGKKIRLVTDAMFYMDDMILFSSNRKSLKQAVILLIDYLKSELGLTVKPNWHIQKDHSIDMMGFVLHSNGKVCVRPRVFVRIRRQAIRFNRNRHMSIQQSKRILSYKGFIKQKRIELSNRIACKKYKLYRLFITAQHLVKAECRRLRRKCHERSNLLYENARIHSVYAD